jgi:hypothetical protein
MPLLLGTVGYLAAAGHLQLVSPGCWRGAPQQQPGAALNSMGYAACLSAAADPPSGDTWGQGMVAASLQKQGTPAVASRRRWYLSSNPSW